MNGLNHATVSNACSVERSITHDDEIVSAAQAGCPKAFAALHAIYSRRLYSTILAITRSPEDAEDALQETFMRVHLAIHTFEGRSTVYSWLTRIAINSALMVLRKRRARTEILFDPQPDAQADAACFDIKDSAPNPEQIYDLRQRFVRLLRAIRKLSPSLREPIQMRMTNESSLKEIGRSLNITEAAVKARLYRARLRLSATYQRS
jgi:RNA polymerase sigma-70 factor (ECF subfamily)